MAKKITQMTEATEIKTGDISIVVQDGETKQFPLDLLATKSQADEYKTGVETKLADYEQEITDIKNKYDKELYTPTITVTNTSMVKTGQGDTLDYSASVEDGVVKSAILSGQTLVNLANYELSTSSTELLCSQDFSLQKNNTAYTLFNFTDKIISFNTYTTSGWRCFENVGANSKRLLTLNDFTIEEVIGRASNGWDKTTETEKFLNGYMIIEGDYTNVDIPYFEGMQ